jgi:NAD(P)-dependent dehydrogenase (short-subunit alcohol dehydrogenase family)
MALDLDLKVSVITGAGRGSGRAFALALASAGCRLAAADVDSAGAEHTASLIRATHEASPPLAMYLDVAQRSSVDQLMSTVTREWSGLDVNGGSLMP